MSELENVKEGDEVILWHSGFHRTCEFKTVERAMKLHLVIDGTKYGRRGGRLVGATGWDRAFIEPATPENRKNAADRMKELQEENARFTAWRKMNSVGRDDLTIDQLQRIAAIIDEASQ